MRTRISKSLQVRFPSHRAQVFSLSTRSGSSVDYKTLFENCQKAHEDYKIVSAQALSLSAQALSMSSQALSVSSQELSSSAELIISLRKDVALLDGLLVSRRVLEEIARFHCPNEKEYKVALRKLAVRPDFLEYLRIVGTATKITANVLSSAIPDAYSDVSSCIHMAILTSREVSVVPTKVFRSHVMGVAVHAALLFYGPAVSASNLSFTGIDGALLVIPAPSTGT